MVNALFQSYLYGIEIFFLLHVSLHIKSFNRTFMELKSLSFKSICEEQRFQSYLYGIEIKADARYTTTMEMFQSYLYGIEIY